MNLFLGVNFLRKKSDFYSENFLLRNVHQILFSHDEGRDSVKYD